MLVQARFKLCLNKCSSARSWLAGVLPPP